MQYPRRYVSDHAKIAHRVDEYSSVEDDTSSGSDQHMTTPGPGAPEPGLGPAAARPGASCGGGFAAGDAQGTFRYGVGMASSDTPSSSSLSASPSSSLPSPPSSSSSPSPDGDGDINMENWNEQHEGHAGSVVGGQTPVMEIDSDDEDMDIDKNGNVYDEQRIHTNRENVERWLDGAYAVGYGPPRGAQEEMQHFDRHFGAFGL